MNNKLKLNKKLLWDYYIKEEDLEKEEILILYISKVLNNGTLNDISEIPVEIIEKYIDKLFLSRNVRKFWKWYIKITK
ncbi:MAG: hypothetical protein ACUVWP_08340 [bacterium]